MIIAPAMDVPSVMCIRVTLPETLLIVAVVASAACALIVLMASPNWMTSCPPSMSSCATSLALTWPYIYLELLDLPLSLLRFNYAMS